MKDLAIREVGGLPIDKILPKAEGLLMLPTDASGMVNDQASVEEDIHLAQLQEMSQLIIEIVEMIRAHPDQKLTSTAAFGNLKSVELPYLDRSLAVMELRRQVGEHFTRGQLAQLMSIYIEDFQEALLGWVTSYIAGDLLRYELTINNENDADSDPEIVTLGEMCDIFGITDVSRRIGKPEAAERLMKKLPTGKLAEFFDQKLFDSALRELSQQLVGSDLSTILRNEGHGIADMIRETASGIVDKVIAAADKSGWAVSHAPNENFTLSEQASQALHSVGEYCTIPLELHAWIEQLRTEDTKSTVIPMPQFNEINVINVPNPTGEPDDVHLDPLQLLQTRLLTIVAIKSVQYKRSHRLSEHETHPLNFRRQEIARGIKFFAEQFRGAIANPESNEASINVASHALCMVQGQPNSLSSTLWFGVQDNPRIQKMLGIEPTDGPDEWREKIDRYVGVITRRLPNADQSSPKIEK